VALARYGDLAAAAHAMMGGVSADIAMAAADRCDCHDRHSIAEIAGWSHGSTDATLAPVSEWSARPDLWERSEMKHGDLTAAINAAGGVACKYALKARVNPDGSVHLENGVHRWTVCSELGIEAVPVRMTFAGSETTWPEW
jgi:hypothetical protein